MSENIIEIYCGVKYCDKDEAKKLGAKWNKEHKAWYFKFNLIGLIKDDTKHTAQFKPFSLTFKNCEEYIKNSPLTSNKFYDYIFQMVSNRNKSYIKIQENEKPDVDRIYVLKQN